MRPGRCRQIFSDIRHSGSSSVHTPFAQKTRRGPLRLKNGLHVKFEWDPRVLPSKVRTSPISRLPFNGLRGNFDQQGCG